MLRHSLGVQWLQRCSTLARDVTKYSYASLCEPDTDHLREQLLHAAVKHVKQHGWTHASLTAAARDLQLSPALAGILIRGPSELVEHVIKQHNQQLAQDLQANQQDYLKLPIRQRIAVAVRKRLEMNTKYMDSWPQALSLLAQPRNSPEAAKLLFQLLDDIWYAAGDTSTDINWYTKRALLAAVYTSTELYMLTDFSPGYQDTWEQLDRRIADVLWLGSAAKSAAVVPQQLLTAVVQALSSTSISSVFSSISRPGSAAAAQPTSIVAATAAAQATASGSQYRLQQTPTGLIACS